MAHLEYMKSMRHQIHQNPELAYNEHQTAELVANELKKMGYENIQTGVGKTGVVALIDSGKPGPCVGLRADMDALPLKEKTGLPYASRNDGVMHACGHDGHTATLLGVAKKLIESKDQIQGKIKLIFQPAEEGQAGARAMIEDGVLESPKVDFIFGYHNWPEAPLGKFAVKSGCLTAATTNVEFLLKGKGGHAALPHLCDDTIFVGTQLVQSIHAMLGRTNRATNPAVLSITQFSAGQDSYNVMPDQVKIMGTLRTTSPDSRKTIKNKVYSIVDGLKSAHGIEIEANLEDVYPPTMNTPKETEYVRTLAKEILGEDRMHPFENPSMGGEDFSFFLEKVPGCYFLLGNGGKASLHNPHYDYNDDLLETASEMMLAVALNGNRLLEH